MLQRLNSNGQVFRNQAVVVWLHKNHVTMFVVLAVTTIMFHSTADVTITYVVKGAESSCDSMLYKKKVKALRDNYS
jgi:hypothetical protein